MKKIKTCQNSVLNIVNKNRKMEASDFNRIGVLSLKQLIKMRLAIYAYRNLKERGKQLCSKSGRRKESEVLYIVACRTTFAEKRRVARAIKNWNQIPLESKRNSSEKIFRRKLKDHSLRNTD